MAVRKVIKGEAPVDAAAASSAALSDRKVIDREVFHAQQRAEQIKQESEAQATTRRAEGQAQAEEVHQQAFARGSADGTCQAAQQVIAGYHKRGETLRQAVDDCILLARRICAKVMGAELKLDDSEVRRIAQRELERTTSRRRVTVSFSPDRLAMLEASGPLLWRRITSLPEFALAADSGLPEDVAQVTSDAGEISVDADRAELALREVLEVPVDREPVPEAEPDTADPPGGEGEESSSAEASPAFEAKATQEEDLARSGMPLEERIAGSEEADPPEGLDVPLAHDIGNLVAAIDSEEETP
ncbi:MAG: hypothetical protein ABIJ09_18840 [Pseudomonadota bacterium]